MLTVTLRASWAHSLKDKRAVIKSLTTRLRAKFNVSVAEAAQQDNHQVIVLAIAALAANTGQADSILASVQRFILASTDAEMIGAEEELR